ncbi:MAG TPA: PspC domain-containing protein [Candidatus Limnocylindria bacterium]|jgi:phage shock protein C|nr:PspC domain-containing protein [Candidatus Limnocylindria bacterium]
MTRRLYRSRTDTVLGGVAAGLANYLNADPALVRIAWAILVPITGGAAFLAYIVAWIVVPEEAAAAAGPSTDSTDAVMPAVGGTSTSAPSTADSGRAGLVVGIGLVVIGVWFLVRDYLPDFNWNLVWPAVLIGIGALILINSSRRRG